MAQTIVSKADYTFSALAGTIIFSTNYTGLELANILVINNLTKDILLYSGNENSTGTLNGLTLTLQPTVLQDSEDSDELRIIIMASFLEENVSISGDITMDTSNLASESTLSTLNTKLPNGLSVSGGRLQVELPAGSGGLTNTELRASAVAVSLNSVPSHPVTNAGTFAVQATLGAETTKVIGTVNVAGTIPISGALTDTQIRATPLAISGAVSTGLLQPLTDTQLRATPIAVAGAFFQATQPVSIASMPITPVTGTFFQAIQPISAVSLPLPSGAASETTLASINTKIPQGLTVLGDRLQVELPEGVGGLTNTELRATPVPVSIGSASVLFKGRTSSFRTPGRAGTTGQKIFSIYNGAGSPVSVQINKIYVDFACTVIKAVTVLPPIIRMWKVTVAPTQGTVLTKNKIGGTSTSSASVEIRGDASTDGTISGTTLAATLPAGTFISQKFAPRLITAAGYDFADALEFLNDSEVILAEGEGIVVHLDYVLATQNPTTDMWVISVDWLEK